MLQDLDLVFAEDGYVYMKSPVLSLLPSGYLKGAINDITTDINKLTTITPANAEYYDLQGHKISSPTKGINIVRQVDGKVVKM
ncbi:MAG: hypothetical protein VZR53_13895, partial [Prevotella sp.]|nr:hypothetical protein [Prevotella sp.]